MKMKHMGRSPVLPSGSRPEGSGLGIEIGNFMALGGQLAGHFRAQGSQSGFG